MKYEPFFLIGKDPLNFDRHNLRTSDRFLVDVELKAGDTISFSMEDMKERTTIYYLILKTEEQNGYRELYLYEIYRKKARTTICAEKEVSVTTSIIIGNTSDIL